MFLSMEFLFGKMDWTNNHTTPLYQIYILNKGQSSGVFQAQQLILLGVFGDVDEVLVWMMVQFWFSFDYDFPSGMILLWNSFLY